MTQFPKESEIIAIIKDNTRKKEQNQLIHLIKANLFPKIIGYLRKRTSQKGLDRDIFHETLLRVILKIKQEQYTPKGKFQQYFMGVAKRVIYEQCDNKITIDLYEDYDLQDESKEIIEQLMNQEEKWNLYLKVFNSMKGTICYKVLTWKIKEKHPLAKIQEWMDWSKDYTKKRSSICKKKLIKLIENEPKYQALKTKKKPTLEKVI